MTTHGLQEKNQAEIRITAQDVFQLLSLMQQRQLPEVLHVIDIEKILRVSHYTSGELVKSEHFPSFKVGKNHKIPRDVFFEWMQQAALNKSKFSIT